MAALMLPSTESRIISVPDLHARFCPLFPPFASFPLGVNASLEHFTSERPE
jgi:hypothetical protein